MNLRRSCSHCWWGRRRMSRRVSATNARETLVARLADEERPGDIADEPVASASPPVSDEEFKRKRKALVRAAGRAALEESLLSGSCGVKRKASEMTGVGIAAQCQAYAEVYGTNGMAAGGASSSSSSQPAGQPEEIDFTVPVGAAAPAAASTTTTSVSEPQQSVTDASAAESSPQDDAAISAALAPDPEVQEAVRDGPRDISFFCP